MTVGELREELAKYPEETIIYAPNFTTKRMEPVIEFLFDPPLFGVTGRLEFKTD